MSWDSFGGSDLLRAHPDGTTSLIAAPSAGFKIVVLALSLTGATSGIAVQETGGSPQTFAAINGAAVNTTLAWNPVGWLETRDGRGLASSANLTGVIIYKVVPA